MKRVGLALVGLGNVGRRFLRLLLERDDTLRQKYGLAYSKAVEGCLSGQVLIVD